MATKKEPGGERPSRKKIVFSEEQLAKAEECLKKNNKIVVGMKEVVYTKLPKSFDPPVTVD